MARRLALLVAIGLACTDAAEDSTSSTGAEVSTAEPTATASTSTTASATVSSTDATTATTGMPADSSSDGGSTGEVATVPMVYVGGASGDILVFELDVDGGTLVAVGEPVPAGNNPAFLAVDPQNRVLIALDEQDEGLVRTFAIEPGTGALTPIDEEPSGDTGPAFVATDRTGAFVLVAHYNGGSVTVLPLDPDGMLGAVIDSEDFGGQANSHAFRTDPSNRYALVPNRGLDRVAQLVFDDQGGTITPNRVDGIDTAPGAGPRHLDFHPSNDWVYVVNEQGDSVAAYALDPDSGQLAELSVTSTLPDGFDGNDNTGADIHVHPDGGFVYSSNRGHDSLAVFAIDAAAGTLTAVGHVATGGQTPRNFTVDPEGEIVLVANQESDSVVVFRVDRATGMPAPTGAQVDAPSPSFVGIVRLPA